MSRNFVGSSYHGSNDYKKFRQERLKKNCNQNYVNDQVLKQTNNLYESNTRSTCNLNTDKRQYAKEQLSRNVYKNKWNDQVPNQYQTEGKKQKLHTFNKNDFKDSYSYGRQETGERNGYPKLENNYSLNENPKYYNEKYSISSTNRPKFGCQNQYDNQRQPLNDQNKWQQRSIKKDYRQLQTYRGNKYETNRENREFQLDKQKSFQDQVILRSLRYQYANKSLKQSPQKLQKIDNSVDYLQQKGKTFRYTQKLANSFSNNNFGQDFSQNTQKSRSQAINPISNEYFKNKNFNEPKFSQKVSINSYESKLNNDQLGSYRYRNQIIKQRLTINNQPQYVNPTSSNLKRKNHNLSQIDYSNPYESKYKTNQVTPQKSYNLNNDRQLSQQRRKSLIQKSQILKQKLNRMNVSNNKKESIQQKSKIYTPNKQSDCGNQEKGILVTKRLNFNEDVQSDRNSKLKTIKGSNLTKNREAEPIRTPANSKQINKQNENLPSNSKQFSKQDPLKKISQLNEKINDRLQSILRNYG